MAGLSLRLYHPIFKAIFKCLSVLLIRILVMTFRTHPVPSQGRKLRFLKTLVMALVRQVGVADIGLNPGSLTPGPLHHTVQESEGTWAFIVPALQLSPINYPKSYSRLQQYQET